MHSRGFATHLLARSQRMSSQILAKPVKDDAAFASTIAAFYLYHLHPSTIRQLAVVTVLRRRH